VNSDRFGARAVAASGDAEGPPSMPTHRGAPAARLHRVVGEPQACPAPVPRPNLDAHPDRDPRRDQHPHRPPATTIRPAVVDSPSVQASPVADHARVRRHETGRRGETSCARRQFRPWPDNGWINYADARTATSMPSQPTKASSSATKSPHYNKDSTAASYSTRLRGRPTNVHV
jgi:hypothetical protein